MACRSAVAPIKPAVDAISHSISNCFLTITLNKTLIPVTFPPGRLKLATRPSLTGSAPVANTMGIVCTCSLCRKGSREKGGSNDRHPLAHEVGREHRQSLILSFCPSVLQFDVAAIGIPSLTQTLPEGADTESVGFGRSTAEQSNHRHGRLLRARRERPSDCGATPTQNTEKFPPPHTPSPCSGNGILTAQLRFAR